MPTPDNNLVWFENAQLADLAGLGEEYGAAAMLAKFSFALIARPALADLRAAKFVLTEAKVLNPALKVFGMTTLAGDPTTWQVEADAWLADFPAPATGVVPLLDGLAIDQFDRDPLTGTPTTTTAEQNTAVDYVHAADLSVMVIDRGNPAGCVEADGVTTTVSLGADTALVDYVLLDELYLAGNTAAAPTLEGREHLAARLQLAKKRTVTQLKFVGCASAGDSSLVAPDRHFEARALADRYGLVGFGIRAYDKGTAITRCWLTNLANEFRI